ncbi:MAG TPA: DUF948 domain-containing protein [Geobacteraceae bacterium]|nr:DUF948 domain-containing protein [Geobacteraceae bacterium]
MDLIGVAMIVAAIALVALACFAFPVLLELKKTMAELRRLAAQAEEEMKPVMQDLHETLAGLKVLTREASDRIGEVKGFTEAVGDAGRHIRSINTVLGLVTGVVSGSTLWLTGAKVAGKVVLDRFTKKGGK